MLSLALTLLCLIYYGAAEHGGCKDQRFYCVAKAFCDKANDTCVCSRRTQGDGEMECYNPRFKHMCTIDSNPSATVRPYDGEIRTAVSLPCWYRASSFRVRLKPFHRNQYLAMDVLVRNALTSDGNYYIDEVKVITRHLAVYTKRNYTRVMGKTFFYIKAQHVWQTKWHKTPWVHGTKLVWRGMTFHFLWDKREQFAILRTVTAKGIKLKFRAYHPTQRPQPQKPGLVIVLNKNRAAVKIDPAWHGVCLGPGQGDFFHKAGKTPFSLAETNALLYALTHAAPRRFDSKPCRQAKKTIKKCHRYNQLLAIDTCGFLLNNRDTVKCLLDGGEDPMKSFLFCLRWMCSGRTSKCEVVQKAVIKNGCPVSNRLFHKIGCSPVELQFFKLRFHSLNS